MRRQLYHVWLATAAGGCLLLGCHNGRRYCPYPEEPLLLTKPPVEGKIEVGEGPQLSRSEPAPPPFPADALASVPRPLPVGPPEPMLATPTTAEPPRAETATSNDPPTTTPPAPPTKPPVMAAPAKMQRSTVPANPVSRIREKPAPTEAPRGPAIADLNPTPQTPAAPAVGPYGHEPGYGWLQGTVDKHYRGRLYLRYCDATIEDRWGGKVCLERRRRDFRRGRTRPGRHYRAARRLAAVSALSHQIRPRRPAEKLAAKAESCKSLQTASKSKPLTRMISRIEKRC